MKLPVTLTACRRSEMLVVFGHVGMYLACTVCLRGQTEQHIKTGSSMMITTIDLVQMHWSGAKKRSDLKLEIA